MKCPNCGYEEVVGTQNTNIIDEYGALEDETVREAVPVVSDYRERYKKREIRMDEITPKRPVIEKIPRQDSELDSYRYQGDSLFFGPGVEVEY